MLKYTSLFALGVGVGALAMWILRPLPTSSSAEGSSPGAPDGISAPAEEPDESALSYEELLEENDELFDLVIELESVLLEIRDSREADRGEAPRSALRIPTRDQVVSQLVTGGFTQERAEFIQRRTGELHRENVEAMFSLEAYAQSPEGLLRRELGDDEYAQYLGATADIPAIVVGQVDDNSRAAVAGLLRGDRIVSYDGHRVFDIRELIALSLQGEPSESIVVEIVRYDAPLQLVIPRGPLGAGLSSEGRYAAPAFVPRHLIER